MLRVANPSSHLQLVLIPTFAKPKLSIKNNIQIRRRIAKSIIEAELVNKHNKLKYLRKEAKKNLIKLIEDICYITLCALNKTINRRISGKVKEWNTIHERKLNQLFKDVTANTKTYRPTNIVHNFSSYDLTAEEYHILSFVLDHHIPTQIQENTVKTEFEAFFYHLNKQLQHLTADERDELKYKLRRSCENYYNTKNTNKVHGVIAKLSKNRNIVILKQDKGRGVVILDKTKYIEKCMEHLNTSNFENIKHDNTKAVEVSVQKALFKVKEAIGEEQYKQIYPSGSNPGKFYGTAKVHKVKPDETDKLNKLPVRPIISILVRQHIKRHNIFVAYSHL